MIINFFSVDNIAFTILGYPMSYVEFIGTILYLWSVWLIAKRNILTWAVGIVSVLLYMILFYQIRLYSDTIEQIYYLGASIYGWWIWNKSPKDDGQITDVKYSDSKNLILWVVFTGIISIAFGYFMCASAYGFRFCRVGFQCFFIIPFIIARAQFYFVFIHSTQGDFFAFLWLFTHFQMIVPI